MNTECLHVKATFQAWVDAVVPVTVGATSEQTEIQYWGALYFHIEEYLIYILNHYLALCKGVKSLTDVPLAEPTAKMLDRAAECLMETCKNQEAVHWGRFPGGGAFAALACADRFRAITLLKQAQIDPAYLPVPFREHPGLVREVTTAMDNFTMMGYYSEWSGYGSTRLDSPNHRRMECFPIGWRQVCYPGPSEGYRAMRGYVTESFT